MNDVLYTMILITVLVSALVTGFFLQKEQEYKMEACLSSGGDPVWPDGKFDCNHLE